MKVYYRLLNFHSEKQQAGIQMGCSDWTSGSICFSYRVCMPHMKQPPAADIHKGWNLSEATSWLCPGGKKTDVGKHALMVLSDLVLR